MIKTLYFIFSIYTIILLQTSSAFAADICSGVSGAGFSGWVPSDWFPGLKRGKTVLACCDFISSGGDFTCSFVGVD